MKRLLITIFFVCYCISYGTASVKIKVNGSIDTQVTNIKEKGNFNKSSDYKKVYNNGIITDTYLKLNINSIDNDPKYGAMIKLNANTSKSKKEILTNGKSNFAEQTMIYLENGYGRIEAGSYTGISNAMKINASTFASATGGINGDSQYYWNKSTSHTSTVFLQTPNLPTNELSTVGINGINATKINYYTPEFSGFRAGISYIPDSKTYGKIGSDNNVRKDEDGFENIIETGLSYTGEVNNIGIKLAAVSEFGKNKKSTNKNLNAWDVGMNVSYQGVIIGVSYGSWNKYNVPKTYNNQYAKTNYWTTGIGYEYGPISTSITHLQSKMGIIANQKVNTLRNTVFGLDYKIASGLLPYFEFASFKMKDKSSTKEKSNKDDKGYLFIIGMNLKF